MKNRFLYLFGIMALSLILITAGCSNGDNGNATSKTNNKTNTPSTTSVDTVIMTGMGISMQCPGTWQCSNEFGGVIKTPANMGFGAILPQQLLLDPAGQTEGLLSQPGWEGTKVSEETTVGGNPAVVITGHENGRTYYNIYREIDGKNFQCLANVENARFETLKKDIEDACLSMAAL